jgi:hypothetical protein
MTRVTQVGICATLAALALEAGCRTAVPVANGQTIAARSSALGPRTRGPGNILLGSEIQTPPDVNTAYDAVRRLRPEFLTRHAAPLPTDPYRGYPVLYVDRVREGPLDLLQTIPARAVVEIRFLRASAAFDAFGTYHPGGVIAVRTR